MKALYVAAILIAAGWAGASHAGPPNGYQVTQSVVLRGCACRAEVLEDARLTDAMRDALAGIDTVFQKDSPFFAMFDKAPIRNAAIRIVDAHGKVTDQRNFDVPLAILRDKPLLLGIPKDSIYSLEVDRTAGQIRSTGPAFHFFSVGKGRFGWVNYVDPISGKPVELVPAITIQTDFQLADRADRKGKDFVLLYCAYDPKSPGAAEGSYTTHYTRIHYDGGAWRGKKSYAKPGNNCQAAK